MLKQCAIPLVGFGVGWGGWDLLERYELITPEIQQQILLCRLKAQRGIKRILPEGASALLTSMSLEEMDRTIEHLSAPPTTDADSRLKFVEVLQQCRVQEQLEWMEEHAQEDIPFFFIADLFHAFAALHEPLLTCEAGHDVPLSNDMRFHSSVLVRRTFDMMVSGVMPFDVASRVLAVLMIQNKGNRILASSLEANGIPLTEVVAAKWQAYQTDLHERGTPDGDAIVSSAQVATATTQLLRAATNGRESSRSWRSFYRTPSSLWAGISQATQNSVCQILRSSPSQTIGVSANKFVNELSMRLGCESHDLHSK